MLGGLRRAPRAIVAVAALSVLGAIYFAVADDRALHELLFRRWAPLYFLTTPFMHAGAAHLLFNLLALHFIGGQMLMPRLGERRFLAVFLSAVGAAHIANNIFSDQPAVGISGGIMGLLACSLYPCRHWKMKLLLVHDLLRLPPFPLYAVAAFVVLLDIAGIVFHWRFFAHWGHLGGFAAGAVGGFFIFRARRRF